MDDETAFGLAATASNVTRRARSSRFPSIVTRISDRADGSNPLRPYCSPVLYELPVIRLGWSAEQADGSSQT
jgi:hypothetical protein